jgi:hypothetical protein
MKALDHALRALPHSPTPRWQPREANGRPRGWWGHYASGKVVWLGSNVLEALAEIEARKAWAALRAAEAAAEPPGA